MNQLPRQMFEGWKNFNNEPRFVEVFLIRDEKISDGKNLYQFEFKSVDKTLSFKQTLFQSRYPTMIELDLYDFFEDCHNLIQTVKL